MADKISVAVIMGGVSGEHDVSLNSGEGVFTHLLPDRYEGIRVVILKDGAWTIDGGPALPMLNALQVLKERIDVAFIALHGPNGEDGTIQSLFHLLGIPYTGSDYYASSLAMNKPRTKDVYARAGLAVARDLRLGPDDLVAGREAVVARVFGELGQPVVVKTTKLGSSVGVDIARNEDALWSTLTEFMPLAGEVMVEEFIEGTEVTSSVIDDPYAAKTVALPLVEIRPTVSNWFDHRAKYEVGGAEEICPAPISEKWTAGCKEVGLLAHRLLGCRGMSRTDIMIDKVGTPYVIETNTIPGFTGTSLLPQAAEEAGISYEQLVDMLIQECMKRHSQGAA